MTLPAYGIDATANLDDTYYEVIAARSGEERYNVVIASVATNDALLSLDGGTTAHIFLTAGQAPLKVPCPLTQGAVHAKNAAATADYTALNVTISRERV